MDTPADIEIKKLPPHLYVGRYFGYNFDPHAVECQQPHVAYGLLQIVNTEGRHGLIDLDGNEVLPCSYIQIDSYGESGAIISRPRTKDAPPEWPHEYVCIYMDYDDVGASLADIIREHSPRFYGFVTLQGEEVVPCGCTSLKSCYSEKKEESRLVYECYGTWGVKDIDGRDVMPFDFDQIRKVLINDTWVFYAKKGDCQGVFDFDGNVLFPPEFYDVTGLSEGSYTQSSALMAVDFEDQWYVIDVEGNKLGSFIHDKDDRIGAFKQVRALLGSAFFEKHHNQRNEHVIRDENERDGFEVFTAEDDNKGVKNAEDNVIIPARFDLIFHKGRDLFVARKSYFNTPDKLWRDHDFWLFDGQGKQLNKQGKKHIFETTTGKIALVGHEGEVSFYDEETRTMKRIRKYRKFRSFHAFDISEPYYLITNSDGWTGLADGNGCVVVPMEFSSIDEHISERTNTFTAKHQDGSWYAFTISR